MARSYLLACSLVFVALQGARAQEAVDPVVDGKRVSAWAVLLVRDGGASLPLHQARTEAFHAAIKTKPDAKDQLPQAVAVLFLQAADVALTDNLSQYALERGDQHGFGQRVGIAVGVYNFHLYELLAYLRRCGPDGLAAWKGTFQAVVAALRRDIPDLDVRYLRALAGNYLNKYKDDQGQLKYADEWEKDQRVYHYLDYLTSQLRIIDSDFEAHAAVLEAGADFPLRHDLRMHGRLPAELQVHIAKDNAATPGFGGGLPKWVLWAIGLVVVVAIVVVAMVLLRRRQLRRAELGATPDRRGMERLRDV